MNKNELVEKLKGKRLLIADDKQVTVQFYIEELEKYDVTVDFAESLTEAHDFIVKNEGKYDVVVIDVYFPPLSEKLYEYTKHFKSLHMNEGQTLGLFLKDKYPLCRYCYISVVDFFQKVNGEFGLQEDNRPASPYFIDKGQVRPKDFPALMVQIIENEWPQGATK